MGKIRIAYIVGGLTSGGVEAVIYNYCSCFDPSKYELVYISYDIPNPEIKVKFEKLNFKVYLVTKKKDNIVKSMIEVYRILKKHKINIIHSHMTVMSFITSFIGIFCGIKVRIAHAHLDQNVIGFKKLFYFLCKTLTKLSSTEYFACGISAAKFLYGERCFEKGRVRIIKNAINGDDYIFNKNIRNKVREEYCVYNKLLLGNVARFTEQKNHGFLIEIFKKIYEKNKDIMLLCVGDGPLLKNIKQKVIDYGLEKAVIFTGFCDNLNEIYQAFDVFLLPSLYEGLPLVLVEAQASGLKICASDKITKEIAITDNIKYLPIESTNIWVKELMCFSDYQRLNSTNELIKAGYDIKTEALKLDSFYTNKLRDKVRIK